MRRFVTFGVIFALGLAFSGPGAAEPLPKGPPLSSIALLSGFARENGIPAGTTTSPAPPAYVTASATPSAAPASVFDLKVNQDYSLRPQNETTIAINPWSPNMLVAGANDYRLGNPVGAAFYTTFDGGATWTDGFPPFPLLAAQRGRRVQLQETPFGTGDPVVAFGRARSVPGGPSPGSPLAYMAYLGASGSFCEHGIFVSRSSNGLTWTRPVVPPLLPPNGAFTPAYWDSAEDCHIFNDKPWLTVDTSGGPHDGRVYVTWSRFRFWNQQYRESPILMSYSDDNGETWSRTRDVSGRSAELCGAQIAGKSPHCDESQFSSTVVGKGGILYTAFLNQQYVGEADGFRNQYLVTAFDPDTNVLSGPFRAASLVDGEDDFPASATGHATLCNSNFRLNSVGNLAMDPSDPSGRTLYLVFADNRNGSPFPDHPQVTQEPPDSFACPGDATTDDDVFIVKTTDGARTWHNPADASASPLRVNQDALQNGKDQWFPFVAIAPDGRVDVIFYDRRDDPFNRLARVYLARSGNGGASWTEMMVSSSYSNMNWAFDGGQFIGDYNGMAIDPDGVSYPFWTDARGGTPSVRQSDVYMAIIPP